MKAVEMDWQWKRIDNLAIKFEAMVLFCKKIAN
jgi:hypothetical protein